MSSCLYCGAVSVHQRPALSVCQCGRSGSWGPPYRPKLIECGPQFDTPEWLRFLRFIWYSIFPVNGPIVADAVSSAAKNEDKK